MVHRLYLVLETFLILWALGLALDAVFPCLFGDAVSKVSLSSCSYCSVSESPAAS